MITPKYQRVVLKLSGEALAGDAKFGVKPPVIREIIQEIKEACELGAEMAVVTDGGNVWCGQIGVQMGMEHAQVGCMGMLVTVMDTLALQDTLENVGVPTRIQASIEMRQIAGSYIRRKTERRLEGGRITIFASDTGDPYSSTDITVALRVTEIGVGVILMAKNNVDGVCSADPKIDTNAVKFEELTYLEAIAKGLQIMGSTASSLSMDNDIPLFAFNSNKHGNIRRIISGENIGTTVRGK